MPSCVAVGCFRKETTPGALFFRFPKDDVLCLKWKKAVGKLDLVPKEHRVCDIHFESDMILRYATTSRLKPGAIPTIFPHSASSSILREHSYSNTFRSRGSLKRIASDEVFNPVLAKKVFLMDTATPSIVSESTVLLQTTARDIHILSLKVCSLEEEVQSLKAKKRQAENGLKGIKIKQQSWEKEKVELEKNLAKILQENRELKEKIQLQKLQIGSFEKLFNPDQFKKLEKVKQCSLFQGDNSRCTEVTLFLWIRLQYNCKEWISISQWVYSSKKNSVKRNFQPGILYEIVDMMKSKATCLNIFERQVGIIFDEMAIAPSYSYNRKSDQLHRPHHSPSSRGNSHQRIGLPSCWFVNMIQKGHGLSFLRQFYGWGSVRCHFDRTNPSSWRLEFPSQLCDKVTKSLKLESLDFNIFLFYLRLWVFCT